MEWIELIELRSTGMNKALLTKQLSELICDVEKNNKDMGIKIFIRFKIDTDFRIYLKHNSSEPSIRGNKVGQRLVAALKECGLVNHSIWIEMDQKSTTP